MILVLFISRFVGLYSVLVFVIVVIKVVVFVIFIFLYSVLGRFSVFKCFIWCVINSNGWFVLLKWCVIVLLILEFVFVIMINDFMGLFYWFLEKVFWI